MTNDVRLVLMSCCAPCSCGAIKQLHDMVNSSLGRGGGNADGVGVPEITDFIVLFYNPNIYPETEYQKRLDEQIKYCDTHGVKYTVLEYDHDRWIKEVGTGREALPERSSRCAECFKFRFSRGIKWAAENGYNAIASVFGVSKHKDQSQVDLAAATVCKFPPLLAGGGRESEHAKKIEIKYLPIKWDENLRSDINKTADFYRQNYCGCEFSIRKN